MKKTEKLQLLRSNTDARELYFINEEFTRVKFLLRSISSRKGIQTDEVDKIIASFRKVRIGSVLNEYIKVQLLAAKVEVPADYKNVVAQTTKQANKYITEIVSLADRLLSACLTIVTTLSSNRVGDKKREDDVERALNALETIIDKTARDAINTNFGPVKYQLDHLKSKSINAPEMTSVEVLEPVNIETAEENAVEVKSESVTGVPDDVIEHVDILAGIVPLPEKETEVTELKQAV